HSLRLAGVLVARVVSRLPPAPAREVSLRAGERPRGSLRSAPVSEWGSARAMQPYTEPFFQEIRESSLQSAREMVPLVVALVQPRSVIDVGCGEGVWLSVFAECGVPDICGVDGSHVDPARLAIPAERFLAHDLTQPLHQDREFDLVVSLEVAEHLPA